MSQKTWRKTFRMVRAGIEKELKALEYTVKSCGTKFDKLSEKSPLSQETGFWEVPSSVSSKPPRWITHVSKNDGETSVDFAKDQQGKLLPGAQTVGFINNREGNCAAIIFRVIPAVKMTDETYLFPDWEWLMGMVFSRSLPPGTSGQTIGSFDNKAGTISYDGKVYKIAALYICKTPTDITDVQIGNGQTVSYEEATQALIRFLNAGEGSGSNADQGI
jgi:5-methylcytosine-specific restriction protein B